MQIGHAAPTYAAVLTLCAIGTPEALAVTHREALYRWALTLKDPSSGGFRMHRDGEVDTRATYTILCVADLLNIMTPELTAGAEGFLLACQTFEGGFGGEPGNEAHGGYNFCAMAGLFLLGSESFEKMNLDAVEHWLVKRQMRLEGGFQGRTNKLVDSCYSFWQGGALAILQLYHRQSRDKGEAESPAESSVFKSDCESAGQTKAEGDEDVIEIEMASRIMQPTDLSGELVFNQKALQTYVLRCAQQTSGGMRDKPGKHRDYYHSCYSLSGLSISQNAVHAWIDRTKEQDIGTVPQ